jgi:hypothetical protein
VAPTPGAKRGKAVALTTSGAKAKAAGARNLAALEATWDERHGPVLDRVREALAPLAANDGPDSGSSPASSIHPAPGAPRRSHSRASPRFLLVTHRGGFPDGA